MSNIKKKNSIPIITGCHRMTWRELAQADDLASSLTVDAMLGFSTHKMTEMKLRITDRIKAKFRETITAFQKHKCYETAYDQLTADSNIVKRSLKSDPRFKEHVFRYLLLFDDRSGVEIRPCRRYASENHVGAAIFASKDWPKGSRVNTLVGCIAELNMAEEIAFLEHRKNDFSVMYSSRKNCSQLWLGPAAYVNHDCQPNCEFTINCDGDAQMSLEAKTDISRGDEIFIYYGKHFFDVNNSACECFTCELLGRGYFTKFVKDLRTEPTTTQPSASPLRCLTNHVDGTWNGVSRPNMTLNSQTADASQKREQISAKDIVVKLTGSLNDLPGEVAQLVSTLPAWNSSNDVLPKGSSAGLARWSLSSAYSFRHTGTRLNRVKATLRAATEAAINAHKGRPTTSSGYTQALNNKRRTTSTQMTRRCVAVRRVNCSRTIRPPKVPRPRRSTMWLRSAPVDETEPVTDSTSSLLGVSPLSAHGCRRLKSVDRAESVNPSVVAPSSNTEPTEFVPSISGDGTSPAPPQLDRASSIESVSMPSQLSTAATTPDLQSGCYHGLGEAHVNLSMPTLRIGSQYDGVPGSDFTSRNSSGDTSSTSPACFVEPILGRLLNETRSMDLSFTNSSNSTPMKRPAKRLTNYDARLIAEANLLPPVPNRRSRRRSPLFSNLVDKQLVNSNKEGCGRIRSSRPSRSADATLLSKQSDSTRIRSGRASSNRRTSSSDVGDALKDRLMRQPKRARYQHFVHPTLSSPADLSPLRSDYRSSGVQEAVLDSTSEVASEPPQIYPIIGCELSQELPTSRVACRDRYFVTDLDHSCSTTPLRTDPMDDSDVSGDAAVASHTCSFSSCTTEPLDYIYTDHDYIMHSAHEKKQHTNGFLHSLPPTSKSLVNFSTDLYNFSPTSNQFLTSTPPPPILHPATPPTLDRPDLNTSPTLRKSNWSSFERPLFHLTAPQSCPPKPNTFWTVSNPTQTFKPSKQHLLPFEQRLTVTLKRIGPQSYQISQPDEVYMSQ